MEVTQLNNQLTINSVIDGSNYLHILEKIFEDRSSIVGFNFTSIQSQFALSNDGYHIIYEYKFGLVNPTFALSFDLETLNSETMINIVDSGDNEYTFICSPDSTLETIKNELIDITGLNCVIVENTIQFPAKSVIIVGTSVESTKIYDEGEYYVENNIVYNWLGDEISISNLLTLNTEETNILKSELDYFNTYFIRKYYIELLTLKFQKLCRTCHSPLISSLTGKIFKIDKFNELTIDTIMMGLEVINYLIEYDLYMEAERIVSMLATCSNVESLNCNCYG